MHRTSLALFAVWFTTGSSLAQLFDWSPRADPGQVQGAACFSIGGSGYMGTGHGSGASATDYFRSYDPIADAWTYMASVPGGDRDEAVAFVINGLGYIGMGITGTFGSTKKDLWEYHPAWDAWANKDTLPGPARYAATGFALGDTGYICCGGDEFGNEFDDLWAFHPATNSWEQKASLPGGPRHDAFSFVIDGKAYVGGGWGGGIHVDLWAYDPALDLWEQKADAPGAIRSGSGVTMNGRGYVFWGVSMPNNWYNTVIREYDPIADTWATVEWFTTSELDMLREDGVGFTINDTTYTGAGYNANYGYRNDLWSVVADLTTGIEGSHTAGKLQIVQAGGKLHVACDEDLGGARLTMLDARGCQVMEMRADHSAGRIVEVPMPEVAPGCYLLRIERGDARITGKFVVAP